MASHFADDLFLPGRIENEFCHELSEEENTSLYSKCTGIHGHNYVGFVEERVKVTEELVELCMHKVGRAAVICPIRVDTRTGMVINIQDLKKVMLESIKEPLDHSNVDELPYFKDKVSTGENIAVFVWEQMQVALGPQATLLYEVSLEETENNTFVYRGEKTC